MRLIFKVTVIAVLVAFTLLIWAPWITSDYAIGKVVERLGGPDTHYNYLNQDMAVKDVPKEVSWFPFGRFVDFPGEAGWFISFYGSIN